MSDTQPSSCCRFGSTKLRLWALGLVGAATIGLAGYSLLAAEKEKKIPDQVSHGKWMIHDMTRPKPPVVTPGTPSTQDQPGKPPSDAVILFDGKDLSKFKSSGGGEAKWKVADGVLTVDGTDSIETAEPLGDMQLHVEWTSPNPPTGESQGRGNSGLYIMGKYEVQILDSYHADTYADGQASAIYGQQPPLVNACKAPGEWQTYDIIFRGPRWDASGQLTRPTTITVLQNGVVTQDHYQLTGGSGHYQQPPYKQHPDKLPLQLQNHHNPVRYRNIWYRPLPEAGPRGEKLETDTPAEKHEEK